MHSGRPVTFDGPTHLTTMAQFATGLLQRQFPVSWADGFGNYGMPIPIIAQQTTSYLGGFFYLIARNIFVAYNLTVLLGAFVSVIAVYVCLRYWYSLESSLAGALLFMFAPYRMINVFIRGDIPEFFVSRFLPITSLGFLFTIQKRKWWGLGLVSLGVSGILFTHPIMTVPLGMLLGPIWLVLAFTNRRNWKALLGTVIAAGFGAVIAAFYLVPLFGEIKYFYYGLGTEHLINNQYLSLQNFFHPGWFYFWQNDTGPRGQYFHMGSLEGVIFLLAIAVAIWSLTQKNKQRFASLYLGVGLCALSIFLTLPASDFIYQHVLLLNNIQHPWRMLTALIFLPPFLLTDLSERFLKNDKSKQILVVGVTLFVILFRIPQTYGKNYIYYPESMYFFTITNLHGTNLNTVWTGNTRDYPVKEKKYEVIEGNGTVTKAVVQNGIRHYTVQASGPVRLADYTFYFPGWKLSVDGKPASIEFQDMNYRGVITYKLDAGTHQVDLVFGDTNVRKAGKILSLAGLLGLGIWLWSESTWHWLLGLDNGLHTLVKPTVLQKKTVKNKRAR